MSLMRWTGWSWAVRCAVVLLTGGALSAGAASRAAATTVDDPVTFTSTGGEQAYAVPAGISGLAVAAVGARGGIDGDSASVSATGAQVTGEIAVTPGETLYVEVVVTAAQAPARRAAAQDSTEGLPAVPTAIPGAEAAVAPPTYARARAPHPRAPAGRRHSDPG